MTECRHLNLVLLTQTEDRIRCRHCHLTLRRSELETSYCPECFESSGVRRSDFDTVTDEADNVRYRCEDCGMLIETDS